MGDVFFVISGYLIPLILLAEIEQSNFSILRLYLNARGIGGESSVFGFTLAVPLVFFALAPISITGWGEQEVGASWLLGLMGVAAEKR